MRLANEPDPSARSRRSAGLELTDAAPRTAPSRASSVASVDAADAAALRRQPWRRARHDRRRPTSCSAQRPSGAGGIARLRASATPRKRADREEADSPPALPRPPPFRVLPASLARAPRRAAGERPAHAAADVGVGVGPSLPGSRHSPPASPGPRLRRSRTSAWAWAVPPDRAPHRRRRRAGARRRPRLARRRHPGRVAGGGQPGVRVSPDVSPRGSGSPRRPDRDRAGRPSGRRGFAARRAGRARSRASGGGADGDGGGGVARASRRLPPSPPRWPPSTPWT